MKNRLRATSDNKVEIWCSPELEGRLQSLFEIEMLQGIRVVQEDGLIYLAFETTPEKIEAVRVAFLRVISKSDNIQYN